MIKQFLAVVLALSPLVLSAQILAPVHWTYGLKKISGNEYAVHMKAQIDPGWHIYAQNAGTGPIPTSFKFDQKGVTLVGKTQEDGKLVKHFDKSFNSELKYYEHSVDFVQLVRVKPGTKAVNGSLEFMVCNDANCLPPKDIDFQVNL
ncbi:MAG TPA: protein-disulfide reductase DsbD domain-containing protein [Chitinophagaceae bacterium]|nr:protein-disulfide reductase DsbD domain-containing protein [Chitinophagaceae bacterium]